MSVCMSVCNSANREPVLQRKFRPSSSSTKSQIFTSDPSTTKLTNPLTTTMTTTTTTGSSTAAVHPTSSMSVPSPPAAGSTPSRAQTEYMLLGDQSKFASNVVYHLKPRPSDHTGHHTTDHIRHLHHSDHIRHRRSNQVHSLYTLLRSVFYKLEMY